MVFCKNKICKLTVKMAVCDMLGTVIIPALWGFEVRELH